MEKQQLDATDLNEAYFGYETAVPMGVQEIRVRSALRQSEREAMALEMAGATLVFDEEAGVVYEGYNRELIRAIKILAYYTDIDMSGFDAADGRHALYDFLRANGALAQIMEICEEDMYEVDAIYHALRASAQKTFEKTHSLAHLAKRSLGSLLTGEDIAESLAKASAVNNQMVDMLGAFRREKAAKPGIGGNVMRFAKKDT